MHRCGVRKLVIVTSHGGNVAAMDLAARDLRVRLGMLVVTAAWHRFGYPPGTFESLEQRHGIHAGDVETSLVLADRPETVHMERAPAAIPATVEMAGTFKWLSAFRPAGFGWMTQDCTPAGRSGMRRLPPRTRANGLWSMGHTPSWNCCRMSIASTSHGCGTGRAPASWRPVPVEA